MSETASQSSGDDPPLVAVTGATGYVGGRLAPRLLDQGFRICCLVRDPLKLRERPWRGAENLEVVRSDLSEPESLAKHLAGCRYAYYLVHSMEAAGDEYAKRDQRLADNFARAAKAAGVERIIYLGGLGESGENLSEHLASRREVERVLGSAGVPVTV
ncbi:MAG: NAD(P)H-binding protein, partial [Planctomycetota bacterium]